MSFQELSLDERKQMVAIEMKRLCKLQKKDICSSYMWEGRDRYFPSFQVLYRLLEVKSWTEACEAVGMPANPAKPRRQWGEDKTENKRDILDAEMRPLVVVASQYRKPYRYYDPVAYRWIETVVHPCGRFENASV